jgi:hypothetical protein
MLLKRIVAMSVLGLLPVISFSQIKPPQAPQTAGFQSVNINTSQQPAYPQNPQLSIPTNAPQYPNAPIKLGATAQEVIAGTTKGKGNILAINNAVAQKQQEIAQLITHINAQQQQFGNKDLAAAYYRPTPNPERTKDFPAALKHIEDMLTGKTKLSVADAYYSVEAAYGNPYVTQQQYHTIIKESADFIKQWMLENKLNPKDNYMVQYAIRKFMSETLTIQKGTDKSDHGAVLDMVSHNPFHYDYNDYTGEKDYRNLFLTKCLATGYGQCASMPIVYLVLAEALGVKAYLSFAPQHSFVKYPDNDGNIVNYEPTSNWEITDKWYKDNMFISSDAVANGIYLDTLNSKQVVANCAFDLAIEYIKVDLTGKEDMILNCLKVGTRYFPKNNNLQSLFIYSLHLKTMLREEMRKNNIARLDDIDKVPTAKKYYQQYLGTEAYIAKLGYQDMPAGLYEEMLNQQEFKGKIQKEYNITGKDKRNLFSKTDQKKEP